MPMLSIIIPVYNEKSTCLELIERVKSVSIDKQIIVVNDGSTDGSNELLESISNIQLIHHDYNKGKGAAVRTALPYCVGSYVILQDGDLEYDPNAYHSLLKPIINNQAEVIFGSRWLNQTNKNSYHTRGNKMITWFSNFINGKSITDVASCYKVLPLEYLKDLDLKSSGFGLETEIAAKVFRRGYRVMEVSVSYQRRKIEEGKKLRLIDGLISAWSCLRYRFFD
ncbi:MAG: glycosyl transferase [Candidatus Marinimicrobia bacterium]|nr:glycosyl transferase [Candidatus Neomarinimicrobiota bacterium]|tara:strand:- start:5664 stop:6335 length:672 start_codon:yes stop_codon:yes gene_type:complete